MHQMKLGDFININHVKDFSINGKCSMCGECCGAILPVSEKEIKRIKKYVVEHNIKINVNPINTLSEKMIDLTCPFRNNKERKCDIYEVRPKICRSFICNLKNIDNIDRINRIYKTVNIRKVFEVYK